MNVSIIIPCYNRRKYILTLINSFIKELDVNDEVIIVDDGSIDGTKESLEILINNNKNIKYIFTNNMGVSHARNVGIQESKKDYIMFIDSDDYLISGTLTQIKNKIFQTKRNAYLINTIKFSEENNEYTLEKINVKKDMINSKELIKIKCFSRVWRFIVKRELILKNNLLFTNKRVFEDEEWVPRLITTCQEGIEYIDKAYYVYRKHSEEISLSMVNDYNNIKLLMNIVETIYRIPQSKLDKRYVYFSLMRCIRNIFSYLVKSTDNEAEEINKWYKKNKHMIMDILKVRKVYKLCILVFGTNKGTKIYKNKFREKYDVFLQSVKVKNIKGEFILE